jgi:hypothetical protein
MVVLGMQMANGRNTPLVWQTITRSPLRDQRNDNEDDLLMPLAAVFPGHVRVTVVEDRGIDDPKLHHVLIEEVAVNY